MTETVLHEDLNFIKGSKVTSKQWFNYRVILYAVDLLLLPACNEYFNMFKTEIFVTFNKFVKSDTQIQEY